MESLIQSMKQLLWGSKKTEVTGYILERNTSKNMSYILYKKHTNYWVTEWMNDNNYILNTPSEPMSNIF